jgi:hypothetical protein
MIVPKDVRGNSLGIPYARRCKKAMLEPNLTLLEKPVQNSNNTSLYNQGLTCIVRK